MRPPWRRPVSLPSGGGLRAGGRPLTGGATGRLDLDLVVRSHGWYDLPPFSWDAESKRLRFVFLEGENPIPVTVSARRGRLLVTAGAAIAPSAHASKGDRADRRVRSIVSRVLDLDADLSGFHALCREREAEGFGWIAERGAGRILRAPTLFEDAVKILLTTNCSWGLTRAMVVNLVAAFGREGAFPDAPFVAGFTERRLRGEIRCGYRAPYLLRFAEAVASRRLDLSRWEEPSRPDGEVEGEIGAQPGFGPYAVQTLSRLLGRHAKLGLDSWSRKKVAEVRFRGRRVSDARIERFYRPFGPFAGLAFWLDVTRDWHGGAEALWP